MTPQIKTEKEMFPLVEGWLASGLTQKQFCLNHQLPVHILVYWVGRYHKAQPHNAIAEKATRASKSGEKITARDSTGGFIRLSPPQERPLPNVFMPVENMEVVLPTGAIIRFSTTVPISYLKELLSLCSH